MVDVTVLYTHKKTGVFAALLLLTLTLFASIPAARADPSFTLEGVKTWRWVGDTVIESVAVGNVDGDKFIDIVTGGTHWDGTRTVAQLTVWDGGTLQGVKTWYWVDRTHIDSVALGDVDGDGSVEIVTGGDYSDGTRHWAQLCVWDGSTLALEDVTTWYWVDDTYLRSVACGDVDGDGKVEIVTGGYYWDGTRDVAQLCVWDAASLTLENVRKWYWTGNTRINSVGVGHVDADGQVEIVTGGDYYDGTRNVAQVCVWDGSTLALEGVTTWYWVSWTGILSVACANVDNDGKTEIVTGGYCSDGTRNHAQLCVWNGATLSLEGVKTWYWVGDTYITSVACADVDGDTHVEIVTGGYYHDGTPVAQLAVWNGATLALEGVTSWYWVDLTKIRSVAVGDVDGDGSTEIVTGGYYDDLTRNGAQLCVWGFT